MSEMQFTPSQEDAIRADGGAIIVSAAAGSGKTRVLVERVIRILTDTEHPVDADRLLIVTFTRAAAEEMRSRIAVAIEKKLLTEPDNTLLRRQQLLLPNADISTIHSFCSRIIRENFFAFDINQDFRMLSEAEETVLKHRTMSDLLEEYYQQGAPAFLLLSRLITSVKDDRKMEQSLLQIYKSVRSQPFFPQWFEMAAAFYDPAIPLSQTKFAAIAFQQLEEVILKCRQSLLEAKEVIDNNQAFCTKAESCGKNKLDDLTAYLETLSSAADSQNWNEIYQCISHYNKKPYRKPTAKKDPPSEEECTIVKNSFDTIDTLLTKKLTKFFGISEETYQKDTEAVQPALLCMAELLEEFDRRYFEAKKERGVLDFSDLEHLMLQLLVKEVDGQECKTELAQTLSEQYDVIMVDEYQDTNDIQEAIFRNLSRNGSNLFVVGDVKQSIYRFREAKPEIFKERRQHSTLYDRSAPVFPAKVILDSNFRSRNGVIDSINFVFHAIMSEKVGEITYNDEEKLTTGATWYPDTEEAETELHLIDNGKPSSDSEQEEDDNSVYEKEAIYIARLIKKMMQEKKTVTDKDGQRPVRYGDFAVLMRFLSTNGQLYADILNQYGIPTCIDKPYSLFECYEVNLALSMLKIIDNPLQDIPMLAVLLCPVFGFTPDELAELKGSYPQKLIYHRMVACIADEKAEGTSLHQKCAAFSELLFELRSISVTMSVSKLLNYFFTRTAFLPIISAMENGEIRIRNLHKLVSFINDYEGSGSRSLTDLARYINYLEDNGSAIRIGDTAPADAVRIMSIHHSKGLEFPVCIMAALASKGNETKDEVLYHNMLGLGFKMLDPQNGLMFHTLQRNLISYCQEQETKSEAMRVLYVAMTRAKEKLIAVISVNSRSADGFAKKLTELASGIRIENGRISPNCVNQYSKLSDWLLLCALVHPDMNALRQEASLSLPLLPTNSRWKYVKADLSEKNDEIGTQDEEAPSPDSEMLGLFRERFEGRYRYQNRTEIPSKVTASMLVHNREEIYHIAESRPAFLQEKNMTGAEKGTAMHQLLQYADLGRLQSAPVEEVERLVAHGYLTAQQGSVITPQALSRFTQSRIYQRMMQAEQILREYRFTVNIKASDADESYPEDETIILQGAIDCLIFEEDGITIVDYKTDWVKDVSELADRYARQLILYRKAAEQLFRKPVRTCMIYSVRLGEEIEIKE